jgi:hypothetical protein
MIAKNISMQVFRCCILNLALGLVFWVSCSGLGSQGGGLMSSAGHASDVLVVCSKEQWEGTLGDTIRFVLTQAIDCLPQSEPAFALSHITGEKFSPIYQKQRNIVYFQIDPSIEKTKITRTHDKWAAPQLFIKIIASSEEEATKAMAFNAQAIIYQLLQCEIKRFQRAHRGRQNFKISSEIEQLYKVKMVIPEDFIFSVKNKDFAWLRLDTKDQIQSLLIYTQPYVDTVQFTQRHIIDKRNELTKEYIIGSVDSSYLIVEEKHLPILSERIQLGGNFAVRTAGLWKTVGAYMGGAFVNYTMLDTANNRIITIDGFLHFSGGTKRDLMRQLEAILLSASESQQ